MTGLRFLPAILAQQQGGGGPTLPITANLLAHYDASDEDSITVTSGSAVDQWDDLSGNGHHITQTANAAHKPSTGVDTQNGLNVVTFDGTNDVLALTSAFMYDAAAASGVTVYIVFEAAGGTNIGLVYQTNPNLQNTEYGLRVISDFGNVVRRASGGTIDLNMSDTTDVVTSSPHLLVMTDDESNAAVYTDQSTSNSASYSKTATNAPTRFSVGARSRLTNDLHLNGWVGEIAIYETVHGSSDRAAVENYLADKWGL